MLYRAVGLLGPTEVSKQLQFTVDAIVIFDKDALQRARRGCPTSRVSRPRALQRR